MNEIKKSRIGKSIIYENFYPILYSRDIVPRYNKFGTYSIYNNKTKWF